MDKHKKKRKRHSENYQNTDSVLTRNGPSRTKKRPKTIIFPTDCWRIQSKSLSQTSKKILFSRGTVSDLKMWEFLIRTYRIKEYLIHNLKWLWGTRTVDALTADDQRKTKRQRQDKTERTGMTTMCHDRIAVCVILLRSSPMRRLELTHRQFQMNMDFLLLSRWRGNYLCGEYVSTLLTSRCSFCPFRNSSNCNQLSTLTFLFHDPFYDWHAFIIRSLSRATTSKIIVTPLRDTRKKRRIRVTFRFMISYY